MRYDQRENAIADRGGYAAIVPGDPDASVMIQRINAGNPSIVMPPPETHKIVTPAELKLLRQWIAEGAVYEDHWSFLPIQKPTVPEDPTGWAQNPIDKFVIARLQKEGLTPAPKAAPHAILRRLALDLTGLPPTPELVARYIDGNQTLDVEALSRQLLESPQYGIHMASFWLDAARYADSDGYESDPLRTMWPWRDWVVEAFNRNLPYDQFITEQLAGDLLPDASMRQRLATGFNRNHRLNNEGGILPEEWIVEYVCDRAETAATVFMGLTWGCARCHDHKFDPITQRNYYQLFTFFNNIDELGSVPGTNAPPSLEVPVLEHFEEYMELKADWTPLRRQLDALSDSPEFEEAMQAWLKDVEANAASQVGLPVKLRETKVAEWTSNLRSSAKEYFLVHVYAPEELRNVYQPLDRRLDELRRTGARVMIMQERSEPKPAFVLERGHYNQPREEVHPDTPAFLPPMDAGLPKNRLGLARWLTSPDHPLTSRVAVNRIWERFFGTGIVKTQEDFGSQGEPPSHPELLDYLAAWFVESGWNLKDLQLLIVSSATYQQSAEASDNLLSKDPYNRLLARGARYRLSAPVIRDQALAVSGLLVDCPGGPPVKPYQPAGLWEEIIKGRKKYVPDTGEKLYRRSVYTLWRRAVKPPLMELLDANLRDTCAVSVRRTNTPLQALLLLNDVTFVEAARSLAERMINESSTSDVDRLRYGMRLVTARYPTDEELQLLTTELVYQRDHYRARAAAAGELISTGQSRVDESYDPVELAAFTAVARVLLNLDETLSKS